MYAAYFGLKREPFSLAPDPRLLFLSEQHREALAHLLYGVRGGGGFVLLTGAIGAGKTTVCRAFLDQVPPHCNLAYIYNPRLTALELLETVCHEFGIAPPTAAHGRAATVKERVDALNAFLLQAHAAGRTSVLVIDEAQSLAADVLEQLRLLTNLETAERKLLQIVLIGQPELRELLARPELEQLAQRVIARYHLGPLAEDETAWYVRHRLEACGLERPLPFDGRALRRVHRLAGGLPRRINLLCDRALLGAFATGEATVTPRIVQRAAAEVFGGRTAPGTLPRPWRTAGLIGLALTVGLLAGLSGWWAGSMPLESEAWQTASDPPDVQRAAATNDSADVQRAVAASEPAGEQRAAAANGSAGGPRPTAIGAGHAQAGMTDGAALQQRPGGQPHPVTPVATGLPAEAGATAAAPPPRLLRDEQAAWRELAGAWRVELPASGDACAALARASLHCFRQKLALPLIRTLARPGIVTLDGDSGQPSHAVLVGLDEHAATLRAAGTEQRVTLAALAARWDGEFATLWRAPAAYAPRIAAGEGGALVDWLAARLAPQPDAAGPRRFDAALRAQVRAFQTARGLPADGQPGPLTYMELNRASGVEEPRLNAHP